jgi:hypothetical protein
MLQRRATTNPRKARKNAKEKARDFLLLVDRPRTQNLLHLTSDLRVLRKLPTLATRTIRLTAVTAKRKRKGHPRPPAPLHHRPPQHLSLALVVETALATEIRPVANI